MILSVLGVVRAPRYVASTCPLEQPGNELPKWETQKNESLRPV